jgi:hypothetical protein
MEYHQNESKYFKYLLVIVSFSCSAQKVLEKGNFYNKIKDTDGVARVKIDKVAYENFYNQTSKLKRLLCYQSVCRKQLCSFLLLLCFYSGIFLAY